MPGLLDYVKGYQDGGSVDFDPYADTSQADMLAKLGITVDSDAMGLLPTYDPTGADMARAAYDLRGQSYGLERDALALRGRGLDASLDTARRGGTRSLLDLTQQGQLKQAGTGFAGSGAGVQAMTNVRSDIVSGFGDVSADIGRQREAIAGQLSGIGIDEAQSYLDLQQDIWGMQQGYESDLVSSIGDLDPDDWHFGAQGVRDTCNEQCAGFEFDSQQFNDCIDSCYDGGSENTCSDGLIWDGSECVDPSQYEGECPSGWYFDDVLEKCQPGSGSGSGSGSHRP